MKKFVAILGILFLTSCNNNEKVISEDSSSGVDKPIKSEEESGLALIEKSDCTSCHQNSEKMVGPSYQEIAEKYSEGDTDQLADKIINGGAGVWGQIPMSPHPTLSKEQAIKMVSYIFTLKK